MMTSSFYDVINFFQFSACAINCSRRLHPAEESFTIIFTTHTQFILQNICHVIIWWLELIDEQQVKMWPKFNKTRKEFVVKDLAMILSKITLVVLLRHVSKSEQT